MLDQLPSEVLHMIFEEFGTTPGVVHHDGGKEHVRHIRQWNNLYQLLKTSKHLGSMAEPLLYRNYSKPDSARNAVAHCSFRKFLLAVLKRPHLLQYLRGLYIGSWIHYTQGDYRPWTHFQYHEQREFSECSEQLCVTHFPDELHGLYKTYAENSVLGFAWRQALERGEERAEIALLLSLTPNLERIEFSMPHLNLQDFTSPVYYFPQLLTPSVQWDPLDHFHRLKSVVIHNRNLGSKLSPPDVGFEMYPFLPFLSIPSLQRFSIAGASQGLYRRRREEYPIPEEYCGVKTLTISPCRLPPSALEMVLNNCSSLEVFYCAFEEEDEFIPGFSWDSIGRMLTKHQHTLKDLILEADRGSQLDSEDAEQGEETCVPIGSLQNFSKLRYLHVLQSVLLGFEEVEDDWTLACPIPPMADILPPTLEYLQISSCTLVVVVHLEGILEKLSQRFPCLKTVNVEPIDMRAEDLDGVEEGMQETTIKERYDRIAQLRDGFIQAGVEWVTVKDCNSGYFISGT